MADVEIDLADAIDALRTSLEEAAERGKGRAVRFKVCDAKLTVQTVIRREHEGSGRIRWLLVEAGAGATTSSDVTQTLVITLSPLGDDGALAVAGAQGAPGN